MTNPKYQSIWCDGLCCEKKHMTTQDNHKVCKLYSMKLHHGEILMVETATDTKMPNDRLPCLINMPPPTPIIVINAEDD
jgi:hypothetical protein